MFVIISLVAHAEIDKYYKAGDVIDLTIYCALNGTACNDATECNITITYPNDSIAVLDEPMTNNNQYFNYTFYNSTTIIGDYTLGIHDTIAFCESGTMRNFTSWKFEINNYGRDESSNGLIMFLILVPIIAFMVALIIVGFMVPGKNKMSMGPDGNRVLEFTYGYFLKLGCFLFAYLAFWIITFLSWKISQIIISISGFSGILRLMFIFETVLIFPVLLVVVVLGLVKIMQDAILSKEIHRRLPPR